MLKCICRKFGIQENGMDKIRKKKKRKKQILDAGKAIRADIAALVDEESFVELSSFSFSKNEFYGEK